MSGSGPVGVAVIGAGNISKQYLDNLTVFPDLKVHIIADLFEEAAAARAKEYGIPECGGVDAARYRTSIGLILPLMPNHRPGEGGGWSWPTAHSPPAASLQPSAPQPLCPSARNISASCYQRPLPGPR